MVVRFNRGLALRPVHTIKHVVDFQLGLVLAVQSNSTVINTVDNPILATAPDVATNSFVKWIYLKVEAYATSSAALSNIYMILQKSPGANIVVTTPNAVGIDKDKRWVIHQEMVMLQQSDNGNPRTLFAGVIKIPKKMQRMGFGDTFVVGILAPGVNCNVCIQAIYKEIR